MILLTALLLLQGTAGANGGLWVSDSEIAQAPEGGGAWSRLLADANDFRAFPAVTIVDQDDRRDSFAFAAALAYRKTGDETYRAAVESALWGVIGTEDDDFSGENNSSLELCRNVCAVVLAADLIGFREPTFVAWVHQVRFFEREDGRSIVSTQRDRGNNWFTWATASRIACDLYLQDQADLDEAVAIFRGWLGDRSSYSSFDWGELSWQANENAPVGINPLGAIKLGVPLGGCMPDDQRRCGSFPDDVGCKTNYAWEALQGVTIAGVLLKRNGYPDAFRWEKKAIGRAALWLVLWNHQPPEDPVNSSDDRWVGHILKRVYRGIPITPVEPAPPGKSIGYADWTTLCPTWP